MVASIFDGLTRERSRTSSQESIGRAAAGAFSFILFHELGHALVHSLNLPVLGREEDAADQISAFFFLNGKTQDAVFALDGAMWLFREKTFIYTRQHFVDEHSLTPVRRINLACWAYGKDPELYRWVVNSKQLPAARAARCANEYSQLDNAVHTLLGDRVTLPAK